MDWKEVFMKVIFVFCIGALFFGGCTYVNKKIGMEDDWAGEELLEDEIESRTGISIDLTPATKEK